QMHGKRIRERADRATCVAPAIPDARRAAVVRRRVYRERQRRHFLAYFRESACNRFALRKHGHRWHRVGGAWRTPHFLLGVSRNASLALHTIVVRRELLVADGPIEPALITLVHLEVFFVQARPHGVMMRGAATDPVARIEDVADGVLAFFDHRRAGPLEP